MNLQQIYDDNYRLSVTSPDEVYTTRVKLDSRLSRLTEDMEAAGLLRLDMIRYAGDTDDLADRNNQLVNFSSLFRTSELNSWVIAGTFKRDSLLRTVEIIDDPEDVTIEPDDDVDDGLVRQNVRRNRLIIGPGWRRILTERVEAEMDYRLNRVTFENAAGTDLEEFTEHTVRGEVLLRVTEKDRFTMSLAAKQFTVDAADRRDLSYAFLTGIVHEFSETATGGLRVGLRRTEFEARGESSDDSGFILRLDGSKRTGLTTFSGKLERRLAPSASGEQVETTEATFNVSRRLTELVRFTLRSRVFETETLRVDDLNVTRRYLQLEPRLRWRLSRWWSIDSYYVYRRRKIDGDPESASSNAIFFSVNYSQPTALN